MLTLVLAFTSGRQDVLAFDVVARLVDMLKHPSLELQRKVASVLEFVAISESIMDTIISANIESGLLAIFQQIELNGMCDDCFCNRNKILLKYVFFLNIA